MRIKRLGNTWSSITLLRCGHTTIGASRGHGESAEGSHISGNLPCVIRLRAGARGDARPGWVCRQPVPHLRRQNHGTMCECLPKMRSWDANELYDILHAEGCAMTGEALQAGRASWAVKDAACSPRTVKMEEAAN